MLLFIIPVVDEFILEFPMSTCVLLEPNENNIQWQKSYILNWIPGGGSESAKDVSRMIYSM